MTEFHCSGLREGYRAAEYSMYRNWRTWIEARTRYAGVTVPMTLIYADGDWSRLEERQLNWEALVAARHVVIEASGHFASLEKPSEVADIIRRAANEP